MVAKVAALRNSKLSLGKRKRVADSDDEDADEDNTADAQLARALQEQEDAAGFGMNAKSHNKPSVSYTPSRRTSRRSQKILPKTDYASSDDDLMTTSPIFGRSSSSFHIVCNSG